MPRSKSKPAARGSRARLSAGGSTYGSLVGRLLDWFDASARPLPWRAAKDPYAIWISEVMLQQTQVKTVIPYWQHWMRQLPDVRALAGAPTARVLKLWEGLGYYTRARNLQKAAQAIMEQHGGVFPAEFSALLELPGIGRYTAGAIASIAFNQPAPVLDGNVMRVLCRLHGFAGNPRGSDLNRRLWALAGEMVGTAAKTGRSNVCGNLNQALMELGATVCTPREPRCAACPLRKRCRAEKLKLAGRIPALPPRKASVPRTFAAIVLERDGSFLVRQRREEGVNQLLWEWPNFETGSGQAPVAPQAVFERLGLRVKNLSPFLTIRHSIMHYRMELRAYRATLRRGASPPNVGCQWISAGRLAELAFPSAHRRVVQAIVAKPG